MRSLAIHPEDPNLVFAGTSAGQLYLSRDGGRSWGNAGAALPFPGWVVSSLRFDPNRPERLWVVPARHLGQRPRRLLGRPRQDLGDARRAACRTSRPMSLALVPGREGHLYAGTLSGVWGTENSGESWRRLTGDLPEVAEGHQPATSTRGSPTR